MTSQEDQVLLRSGLEELLGPAQTATLWSMLKAGDELATSSDLTLTREELKGEIASVRDELKSEIGLVRAELTEMRSELNQFIRTFIRVQAGTVVGVAGIVFAIVRLG